MKKVVWILVCVTIALLVAIGSAFGQEKAGVVGAWTGYAIVGDGSRFDFNFTVEKGEEGLTGKITEDTGMISEIICRNVAFSENKLTFDIDFPNGLDLVFIRIALVLGGDTLKGFWTDPDGSSDIIELTRKK